MIYVDNREKKLPEIKDILTNLKAEFEVCRLPNGDYLVDNKYKFLLERKAISDFLSNYGELRARLFRMKLEADYTGLLIEGSPRVTSGQIFQFRGKTKGNKRIMSYASFQKFLLREQSDLSYMFHTDNLEQSMMAIVAIHDYLSELSKPKPLEMKLDWREICTLIQGIGEKKIPVNQYNTPLEAFQHIDEWVSPVMLKSLRILWRKV